MNLKTYLTLTGALLVAATAAQATLFTYSGPAIAIPDANPAGISSTIAVSGGGGFAVRDVNVTLNLSGGYNGDLYGYLLGPDGAMAILLNRIGRTSDTGVGSFGFSGTSMNITLDDSAVTDVHAAGNGALTGSYQSDGRDVNPFNALDTHTRSHQLDVIFAEANNRQHDGTWTLFLADLSGGSVMTLNSWSLDITAVPEPATWALLIFGAVAAGTVVVRRVRRQAA